MNDITALMVGMKAAAEKATEAHERLSAMPSDGLFDASLAENAQLESDITALIAHNDASTPANVRALVEALEKAQRWERRWHQVATRVHEQACDSDVKIEELEQLLSDGVTEEALVLRERIAELESRTVTVKLPLAVSVGGQGYREQVVDILAAAGIQVIEGEGQ